MFIKVALVILTGMLQACGQEDTSDQHKVVRTDPQTTNTSTAVATRPTAPTIVSDYGEFGAYVKEFKDLVEKYTGKRPEDKITSIKWRTDTKDHVWASCFTIYEDTEMHVIHEAYIEIDPNMKDQTAELFRGVMLHELGHCIMNSDHVDSHTNLMYPSMSSKVTEEIVDAKVDVYMESLVDKK